MTPDGLFYLNNGKRLDVSRKGVFGLVFDFLPNDNLLSFNTKNEMHVKEKMRFNVIKGYLWGNFTKRVN